MATILLSSVGSLFGPAGQIAGTLIGSAIDDALFAPKDIEGARLKELAVSASSYGSPIARQYGKMRVPGTIIWATDLKEHSDRQSNGKGQPKTVSYSYSISLAVALSSRPIDTVGRIWADGNLLRGTAGDLKSGGTLRIYSGLRDQPRDPLLSAALGETCPAFRGCAYAVFEDLDLTDFGNRIPSLSFEVEAGDASGLIGDLLSETAIGSDTGPAPFPELSGFAYESGSIGEIARLVDRLQPLVTHVDGDTVGISALDEIDPSLRMVSQSTAWDDGDFGRQAGLVKTRGERTGRSIKALRYYDRARDFQPGLQHAANSGANGITFQFPAALSAGDALSLASRANTRAAASRDTLLWRCAELDPDVRPGALVMLPDMDGTFVVSSWEWRERGVELELTRYRRDTKTFEASDPGDAWKPRDRLPSTTELRVFELPWDGAGASSSRTILAAATAATGRWSGCAFHAVRDGALTDLGQSTGIRAISGSLDQPLAPSNAMRFEPDATLFVRIVDEETELVSTSIAGLAYGENRLLVGNEILQFAQATPLGAGQWELRGLLRGRGATEHFAASGHPSGTLATVLDQRILGLAETLAVLGASEFAAIGPWDEEPAVAVLENAGASLRPPSPVHARVRSAPDGSLLFTWTRRARGQWLWPDEVELPLVEETERYEIGYGTLEAPLATWVTETVSFTLTATQVETLVAAYGANPFWVRQIGSHSPSPAIFFGSPS